MKEFFIFLILVCCYSKIIYSQEAIPQWIMPLYFEDANGEKDTVFIGYDSSASYRVEDIDTAFNEGWIKIDTTKFNVILWIYPYYSPAGRYTLTTDSVRKKDISSWPYPYVSIGFTKGKMPVKLKWVDSLLHSPKLPFRDISPRPRARIDFYCESGEPGYLNCPMEYEPLSLTDYPTLDILYPVTDSIVFDGSGSDFYTAYMALFNVLAQVVPHDYNLVGINDPENKESLYVFPNPFTDNINLINPYSKALTIVLYNIMGTPILEICTSNSQVVINSSYLLEGLYILNAKSGEYSYNKKLIKLSY